MRLTALEIAEQQLLTALKMWRDDDFVSCVTLAGAAEEILGKRMRKIGLEPSFDNTKEAIVKFSKLFGSTDPNIDKTVAELMNKTYNKLKHYSGDESLELDLKSDAEEMLERATSNYIRLTGKLPQEILHFWDATSSGA